MQKKLFIAIILTIASVPSHAADSLLRAGFRNPGREHRMNVNQHHLPLDRAGQEEYLGFLSDNGYRGMATNVATTEYLDNEEYLRIFRDAVRKAKSEGFDLWLYDEKLYPSLMADTKVLDLNPEWEAEGLLFNISRAGVGDPVFVTMPGRLVSVQMVPVEGDGVILFDKATNIGEHFTEGTLSYTAPCDSYILVVTRDVLYAHYQAGTERGGEYPRYPSILMPETTQAFIDFTHKEYASAFGEPLGNYFTANFTDEPSSMALPYRPLGYGVYPWKEVVSEEFSHRYGISLEENLAHIALDEGYRGQQLRYMYFSLVADLISSNYFRALKEYCNGQGFLSSGHLLLEECIVAHVPLYGDIMACFRQMDIPGVDVLTGISSKTRSYMFSTRLASSVAELNGGHRVFYESCPIDNDLPGFTEPEALEVKGVINRAILGGVTDFNNYLRLSHESPQGRTAFNEYVARAVSMLYGGHRKAKVAVYYPIETAWTRFRPADMHLKYWWTVDGADPRAHFIDDVLLSTTYCLIDNGWEFSYIDAHALADTFSKDGVLNHGDNLSWNIVILPAVETLPEEAFRKLEAFISAGGTVLAIGTLPGNSENEFPSENIISYFRAKVADGSVIYLPHPDDAQLAALLDSKLERSISFDSYDGLPHCHRSIEGHDVFFVMNDTGGTKKASVELYAGYGWELWDPQTGEIKEINTKTELEFGPYDAFILRTKEREQRPITNK